MKTIKDIYEAMFTHFMECRHDPWCIEIDCPRLEICSIVAAAMCELTQSGEYH